MGKKVLITGAAGFIGSHLVKEMLHFSEDTVYALDDMSGGCLENIEEFSETFSDRFIFQKTDICDYERLYAFIAENAITHIYHLAAIVSVQESMADPLRTGRVNLQGTLNLLEAARQAGAKKVVFSSSAAIYGDEKSMPKNENSPEKPVSPYGYEKMMAERYLKLYSSTYGVETVALRYFNVYGPGQRADSEYSGVISIFDTMLRQGKTPTIYGDGTQYRDFVYVQDVVKANIAAMNTDNTSGEVICIGTGRKTTVNDIFATIAKKYGHMQPPKYEPARKGDVYGSLCDNGKMRKLLGLQELVNFEQGVMKI